MENHKQTDLWETLRAINDSVWEWNIKDNSFWWSDGSTMAFGYRDEDFTGSFDWWESNVHPDDYPRVFSGLIQFLAGDEKHWTDEYRFKKKSGDYVLVKDRGVVFRSPDKSPLKMRGGMTDISSYGDLIAESHKTVEEIKLLTSFISHDIKSPLRTINSYIQLIQRKIKSNEGFEDLREYMTFAQQGVQQLNQMTDSLINFFSLDYCDKKTETIHIEEFSAELRQLFWAKTGESKGVINFYSDTSTVTSNRLLLKIILQNLIENGIKYNDSEQKIIDITFHRSNTCWSVSVKDNGKGIEPHSVHSIFLPFVRLHATNEYEGSGLGLASVKRAVELCGGTLELETAIGEGSNFCITWMQEIKKN